MVNKEKILKKGIFNESSRTVTVTETNVFKKWADNKTGIGVDLNKSIYFHQLRISRGKYAYWKDEPIETIEA